MLEENYVIKNNIKNSIFPNCNKYWGSFGNLLEAKNVFKGHGDNSTILTLFWWFLEIIPIGYLVEDKEGKWRPHHAKLHWSLIWRLKYAKDIDFSHLPKIYITLQEIVELDENPHRQSLNGLDSIVIRIDDIVDIKLGMIKLDFERLLYKAIDSKKNIILDIDWLKPPNEFDHFINLV